MSVHTHNNRRGRSPVFEACPHSIYLTKCAYIALLSDILVFTLVSFIISTQPWIAIRNVLSKIDEVNFHRY